MSGRILIEWEGKTYTIPEDEAFAAAEAVEEVVTLDELSKMRLTKVAKGYSALLRHCGVVVSHEVVHKKLVQAMADSVVCSTRNVEHGQTTDGIIEAEKDEFEILNTGDFTS